MKKNKQQVLNYLFNKLDNIKLELYNIYKYRNRIRIFYDFEKDSWLVGHEHKNIIREKEKKKEKIKEENSIKEVKKYLTEIKLVPLIKVLSQTRKIIFFDEHIYLLKEIEISKQNFLKLASKDKLVQEIKKEESEIIKKRKLENRDSILEKSDLKLENQDLKLKKAFDEKRNELLKDKLISELLRYFLHTKRNFPYKIIVNMKNHVNAFLFLTNNELKKENLEPEKSKNSLKNYKEKISLFKECKSKSSIFYKFTKSVQSGGLHQSFKKINEKILYSNLKDLSKNINRNAENADSNCDLASYNPEINYKTQNEFSENIDELVKEEFPKYENVENEQDFDVRYPFYNDENE